MVSFQSPLSESVSFQSHEHESATNLKVDNCINLETSGNRRSERLAKQNNNLSSGQSALGGKAKSIFFSQSRNVKKIGAALVFALLNGISSPHITRTNTFVQSQSNGKCIGKLGFFVDRFHTAATLYDGTLNELHALAFAAVKGTNETYNFKQAMAQSD